MSQAPVEVQTRMLIRRPVAEVFAAFVDPAITTQFWFTKSSGPLEPGARVQWDWEMYGATAQVEVKAVEPNERIVIEWDSNAPHVEWQFEAWSADTTYVTITNRGFHGSPAEVAAEAADTANGFALVVAGLKAYLEHGIRLNLVPDMAPPPPASS